jgi:hypothetical protein
MGYTHHWYFKKCIADSPERFAEFSADCKKLYENLPEFSNSAGGYYSDVPIIIKGGDGTGEPEFTNTEVIFNGDATDDMDHETFYITLKRLALDSSVTASWEIGRELEEGGQFWDGYDFCKTARKPYDLLVAACLIRFGYHYSEGVCIRPDGGEHSEYLAAQELCQKVFGVGVIPFRDESRDHDR